MNFPIDYNPAASEKRALAYESVIEREYNDLLFNLTDESKTPGKQLTRGQFLIDEMVYEQQIDGTIYAAIKAAAMYLKDPRSMTAEQVGGILIDALDKDVQAVAERNAADGE